MSSQINKRTKEQLSSQDIDDFHLDNKKAEQMFDRTKLTPPSKPDPITKGFEQIGGMFRQVIEMFKEVTNRVDRLEKLFMDYLDNATKGD